MIKQRFAQYGWIGVVKTAVDEIVFKSESLVKQFSRISQNDRSSHNVYMSSLKTNHNATDQAAEARKA